MSINTTSLDEARRRDLAPGDTVLLRDLSRVVPEIPRAATPGRGTWRLRSYQLADGQEGRLLMVEDRAADAPETVVPPELKIPLDLPGWYAIWIGVPHLDWRPRLNAAMGVDLALDDEPGFVHVHPETGVRKGRLMLLENTEYLCFWKCAPLKGRTLRMRVPYGTFLSQPWGMVRAVVSCLKLVRLSEAETADYQRDLAGGDTRRVFVTFDGFSHYWSAGAPSSGIDAHYVQTLRDGDVRGILLQAPATGTANWPSDRLPLAGDMVPEEKWPNLRRGDRRMHDYLVWACGNRQEGMRVMSDLCRDAGMEFHASLRMNLFFANDWVFGNGAAELINGRFWFDHPEYRVPGSVQLDYAHPEVRGFIIGTLTELAERYDVTGINLDFTRWPPVFHERIPAELGTQFLRDVREALDAVGRARGRRLALSALVVDGFHTHLSLPEQRIDLEAWLAAGALDFIGVQAWDVAGYCALARRYGTAFYTVQDQDPFVPGGWRNSAAWQEGGSNEDPMPGEELLEQPPMNSALDPTELDRGLAERYRAGIDGVCLVNFMPGRHIRRLGRPDEMVARAAAGRVWGQEPGQRLSLRATEECPP